jgi:hypothetical protein
MPVRLLTAEDAQDVAADGSVHLLWRGARHQMAVAKHAESTAVLGLRHVLAGDNERAADYLDRPPPQRM